MFEGGQDAFVEAKIRNWVLGLFGSFDVGNGTPAAEALASALLVDLRLSGTGREGVDRLMSLSLDEMQEHMFDVIANLGSGTGTFVLPLGTEVTSKELGGLVIGGEAWLLDADRAGLHPMETMRRNVGGRNFLRLCDRIRDKTRRLSCRNLGLPRPFFIEDGEARHLLQFPPCKEAGDVVLQRLGTRTGAGRFCSAMPDQIDALADQIVADMKLFWRHRKTIGSRARVVREEMMKAAAEMDGVELSKIAIDLSVGAHAGFDMFAEFSGLDDTLRPGVLLERIPSDEKFERARGRAWKHAWHEQLASQLRAQGADGLIDDFAKALLQIAPDKGVGLLAQLGHEHEVSFTVPLKAAPLYATLYWERGVIKGEVTMPNHIVTYGNCIELHGVSLPETVQIAAVGRRLDEIADLPVSCPAVIEEISDCTTALRLTLKYETELVNTATGQIWAGSVES